MKTYNIKDLSDITGFEVFLNKQGFQLFFASNRYLNTYDCCNRNWKKDNVLITIGLMDKPTRIGILNSVISNESNKRYPVLITKHKNYTFLPSKDQYDEYLTKLTT
jgi:hypothetical protein